MVVHDNIDDKFQTPYMSLTTVYNSRKEHLNSIIGNQTRSQMTEVLNGKKDRQIISLSPETALNNKDPSVI